MIAFGSVCSGIGAPERAWSGLGWRCSFMSEIEPFPRSVLSHRFNRVPLHGDFTTIQAGQYAPIDVLVGGTPCQSFSVAGLRGGMADERGNLALEYLRLADRLRPLWLVWENVPGVLSSGGGRDFGSLLGGLRQLGYRGCYRVLDAQFWGVPQRRRRVFLVGYLGDWRPAAAVLLEPASLRGDPAPRREARQRPAPTLAARTRGGGGLGTDFDLDGGLIAKVAATLTAGHAKSSGYRNDADTTDNLIAAFGGNNTSGSIDVATALNASASGRMDFETETFIAHSLRGEGFDASEDGTGRGTPLVPVAASLLAGVREVEAHATLNANNGSRRHNGVASAAGVRRLTPRECERLQGFPDDWTLVEHNGKPAADSPRYRAIGNSMAVPVLRWIGVRIAAQHAEIVARRAA